MNDDATKRMRVVVCVNRARPDWPMLRSQRKIEIAALEAGIRDCSLKVDIGRIVCLGKRKGGTLLSSAKSSKPAYRRTMSQTCSMSSTGAPAATIKTRSCIPEPSRTVLPAALTPSRRHLCPWSAYRTVRTLRPPLSSVNSCVNRASTSTPRSATNSAQSACPFLLKVQDPTTVT